MLGNDGRLPQWRSRFETPVALGNGDLGTPSCYLRNGVGFVSPSIFLPHIFLGWMRFLCCKGYLSKSSHLW